MAKMSTAFKKTTKVASRKVTAKAPKIPAPKKGAKSNTDSDPTKYANSGFGYTGLTGRT